MAATRLALGLFVLQLMVIMSAASGRLHQAGGDATGIACQVMEVHADSTLGVTTVIFHQRDAKDRDALGDFLRANSGGNVEFVAAGGSRHAARMFRLSSCFGRGLLIFSSSAVQLSSHDEILLQK
jgi:hypothetical protein